MLGRVTRGLLAGLLATAVMDASQTQLIPLITRLAGRWQGNDQQQDDGGGSDQAGQSHPQNEPCQSLDDLSSPAKVACRAANLIGLELDRTEAEEWGDRVHWVYGAQWAAFYSLLCVSPSWRSGLLFGAGLWLGSDELLLWALGIAKAPTAYPFSTHAKALAAHLVYGFATGIAVRGLRE